MELITIDSGKVVDLPEKIFERDFNEYLVHQVVNAFFAGGRAGTKAQKNRSAVRGGGIKPWKQKGTGRARAGTIRSPLWRKGGVIFAAQPRSFKQKVNRKVYRSALCSILSELIRQERLVVVENLSVPTAKTKEFLSMLSGLTTHFVAKDSGRDILLVTSEIEENLALASRNLFYVSICQPLQINPVSLVSAGHVIITVSALGEIKEWLQ